MHFPSENITKGMGGKFMNSYYFSDNELDLCCLRM